jgi:nitrate/TMAO reductase-like tetraheme cytochrome c subunit
MSECEDCSRSGWRAFVRAAFGLAVVGVLTASAFRAATAEVVDPHDTAQPKFCLNCHTEDVYAKNCNENEGYCLLAGSVDGLCLTCHIKEECCKPGLEHYKKLHLGMRNHPTDVAGSDIPSAYRPSTLPLQQGRITCRTCHLHTRAATGDYKMLRLVKKTNQGVDWTVLCHDCHKDR